MAVDDDAIGLVRAHRWANIDVQTRHLRADGCRGIINLDKVSRAEVLRLLRDGRMGKLLYAVFLADPRRKRKVYEDFRDTLAKIETRGGIVKDVSTGLDSADKTKRTALLDVVRGQVRRHLQGAKSAENGRNHKPGRKLVQFSREQIAAAKAIWRDLIEYPTWEAADAALERIVSAKGEKFTRWRARRLWGQRQPKRRQP
jgi:hypothetical protein